MCNPLLALGAAAAAIGGATYSHIKKNDKEANAKVQAANQTLANQIENNKIANSVQTTEKQPQQTDPLKKLQQVQKTPLNSITTNLGNQSAVGLNLGGY